MFAYEWYKLISDANSIRNRFKASNEDFLQSSKQEPKTILVSGATNGLGKAAAAMLLCLGHTLVLPRRTKRENEVSELINYCSSFKKTFKNDAQIQNSQINFYDCDYNDLKNVEHFVNQLVEENIQFDAVVNNAGVLMYANTKTAQDFGSTLGINYFATFYLTELVLKYNLLQDSGRLIFVSSEDHRNAPDLDSFKFKGKDVPFGEDYGSGASVAQLKYAQSKQAITTYSASLSTKLKERGIRVISVCPGPIGSNIVQNSTSGSSVIIRAFAKVVDWFLKLFFPTPEKAAKVIVRLTLSEEYTDFSQVHFHMNAAKAPKEFCIDEEKQNWLYDETLKTLNSKGFKL
eukprot:maker-scaffold_33-snap-gene-2.7-mRNA-1 protein AED:0.00 eAED:0.00 QI:89/1/1/1/1/1/2/903/345